MDERDQERQPIDAHTEGTGRLRGGVGIAHAGVDRARDGFDRALGGVEAGAGQTRLAVEDAGWFLRERVVWPVEDGLYRLGRRGAIGVFGGSGIAVAGVVAALLIAGSGGSGSSAGTTEAFVTPQISHAPATAMVAPKAKAKPAKPAGPTLHGAAPEFAPAKNVKAGVGDGKALGGEQQGSESSEAPAARGSATATATANETPAATARIGATPAATASAQAEASSLTPEGKTAAAEPETGGTAGAGKGEATEAFTGPPAPKAAKKVARRFAEAFVVYEVGGVDGGVRKTFGQTTTKQLSRSLLHRPPRQPASVKVPQAKVVNVVAGPSKGSVYTVSVSLLRVGVTSELRLEMEQGVGKTWQVTNVLG